MVFNMTWVETAMVSPRVSSTLLPRNQPRKPANSTPMGPEGEP